MRHKTQPLNTKDPWKFKGNRQAHGGIGLKASAAVRPVSLGAGWSKLIHTCNTDADKLIHTCNTDADKFESAAHLIQTHTHAMQAALIYAYRHATHVDRHRQDMQHMS
jgi:hypothetical protein